MDMLEEEMHKHPLFYAATRLLKNPETLIHQPCIKTCINDKKRIQANPLRFKGLALLLASDSWLYVN
jgi:hypothetical protein